MRRPSVYPKATHSFPLANTLAQYRKPNTTTDIPRLRQS